MTQSTHPHMDIHAWQAYAPPQGEHAASVFFPEENVILSPSAIYTYITCPRQYFYRYVLRLQDDRVSFQARFGIWVHRVLEVFNTQAQQGGNSLQVATVLEALCHETDEATWAQVGFTPQDKQQWQQLTPLERGLLEQEMRVSFEALAESGYFQRPFNHLDVETWLEVPEPGGVKGITLRGRLDLIRQQANGHATIVDYKTSHSQYRAVRLETNMRPLLAALDTVDDWQDPHVRWQLQGRQYQLPLYWLMVQSMVPWKDHPCDIEIQMVRPTYHGGCGTFTVDHATLQQGKEALTQFLTHAVVTPLQETTTFEPLADPVDCQRCAFQSICEGPCEGPYDA